MYQKAPFHCTYCKGTHCSICHPEIGAFRTAQPKKKYFQPRQADRDRRTKRLNNSDESFPEVLTHQKHTHSHTDIHKRHPHPMCRDTEGGSRKKRPFSNSTAQHRNRNHPNPIRYTNANSNRATDSARTVPILFRPPLPLGVIGVCWLWWNLVLPLADPLHREYWDTHTHAHASNRIAHSVVTRGNTCWMHWARSTWFCCYLGRRRRCRRGCWSECQPTKSGRWAQIWPCCFPPAVPFERSSLQLANAGRRGRQWCGWEDDERWWASLRTVALGNGIIKRLQWLGRG